MASSANKPQGETIVRIPFLDGVDLRPGQEGLLTKDRYFLNGFFESIKNPMKQQTDFHFIKRPGFNTFLTVSPTGPGRGIYFWKKTSKIYSVNNNRILSNSTDLGVIMSTSSGFVEFAETRPGATTQYLGINDGSSLYLIDQNDTVIVINNVAVTNVSVANPSVITAAGHGLQTGNKVIFKNITPATTPNINSVNGNNIFVITRIDANTFSIPINVTAGGVVTGSIGVFPGGNTGDLEFMDGYWFVISQDGGIRNCSVDDPTTWPTTAGPIFAQMLPGVGVALARQNNVLVAFTDRHLQLFYDAANPVGSPLANIEQGEQQVGCVGTFAVASNENTIFWISNTLTGGYSVCRLDGTTRLQDIGNPSLRRSLSNNFFPNLGSPAQKQVILTSGTVWTVPSDFNKLNNRVEAIGGGAGGTNGSSSSGAGGGAGGKGAGAGAYAFVTNFDPLGAGTINYVIGTGGASGTDGTDTTFNATTILAKKGLAAGTGGLASACIPSATAKSGGSGSNGVAGEAKDDAGTGLGGDAGAGGGAGGSTAAGANAVGMVGGQGDPPVGGLAGQNGTELSNSGVGSGGGANGGFGGSLAGGNGGTTGLYGAGGGGGGGGGLLNNVGHSGGAGSAGTQGVIIITYTPTTITDSTSANAYILRVSGHIFYIVNLYNSKETWVYDQELNIWYKWADPSLNNWPILKAAQANIQGQPSSIVGQDVATGTLWAISQSVTQDNSVNFEVRIETLPLDFGDMERDFYNRVEVVGDMQASTAPLSISYSDNDYLTFSVPRILDMINRRVYSEMWGQSRRRVWRLSYIGNTPMRVYGFEFTIEDEAD